MSKPGKIWEISKNHFFFSLEKVIKTSVQKKIKLSLLIIFLVQINNLMNDSMPIILYKKI